MQPDTEFHVTVAVHDVDTVVTLRGDVDLASAPTLRGVLAAVRASRHRDAARFRIVIDLSGVTLIDASGLGVLVGAAQWVRRDGGQLVLRDPSPRTLRVLGIARLLPSLGPPGPSSSDHHEAAPPRRPLMSVSRTRSTSARADSGSEARAMYSDAP